MNVLTLQFASAFGELFHRPLSAPLCLASGWEMHPAAVNERGVIVCPHCEQHVQVRPRHAGCTVVIGDHR